MKAAIAAAGLCCAAAIYPALFSQTLSTAAGRVFDVASIRRGCPGSIGPQGPPLSWLDRPSPGSVSVCFVLSNLITKAYFTYAGDRGNPSPMFPPLAGDPPWVRSEQYMLQARTNPDTPQEVMHGSMLRALLEDRFKLRVHRESKQVPVYALTIAKNGPKLEPFKEGACVPYDASKAASLDFKQVCESRQTRKGADVIVTSKGTTLTVFAASFGLGHPVIDRTGLTGRFNLHLEFTPDFSTPAYTAGGARANGAAAPDDPPGGTSIFTAVREQLGLKLEAAKAAQEYIVIDHVERPSPN